MANQASLYGASATILARVKNPATEQDNDTSLQEVAVGRNGDLLVDSLRGQYGALSHRGGVFFSTVTTAAQAIPVLTTTSGSTFCLVNPTGSGVYAEPIDFQLDFLETNAAPATANVVGFSFVPLATNAASSITKAPVPLGGSPGALGGRLDAGVGKAYVATAVTFASALTIAANWGYPMFSFPASWVPTVGGYPVAMRHEFKGKLILPPGFAMTLVASTAWGANTTVPSLSWAELLL